MWVLKDSRKLEAWTIQIPKPITKKQKPYINETVVADYLL